MRIFFNLFIISLLISCSTIEKTFDINNVQDAEEYVKYLKSENKFNIKGPVIDSFCDEICYDDGTCKDTVIQKLKVSYRGR